MGFGSLGMWELLVIAVLALLFVGPRRLPEVARSLGTALRQFKRGLNEVKREFEEAERATEASRSESGPRDPGTASDRPAGRIEPPGTGVGSSGEAPTRAAPSRDGPAREADGDASAAPPAEGAEDRRTDPAPPRSEDGAD